MKTGSPLDRLNTSPSSAVTVTFSANRKDPPLPWMKCDHSQAWEPRKKKPPMMVNPSQRMTPLLSLRWPASTASTMVTEDTMRMNVIKAT